MNHAPISRTLPFPAWRQGPFGDRRYSIAPDLQKAVASGAFERGVLPCGTGIGVCLAAEYRPGGRSAPKIQRIYDYANDSGNRG